MLRLPVVTIFLLASWETARIVAIKNKLFSCLTSQGEIPLGIVISQTSDLLATDVFYFAGVISA